MKIVRKDFIQGFLLPVLVFSFFNSSSLSYAAGCAYHKLTGCVWKKISQEVGVCVPSGDSWEPCEHSPPCGFKHKTNICNSLAQTENECKLYEDSVNAFCRTITPTPTPTPTPTLTPTPTPTPSNPCSLVNDPDQCIATQCTTFKGGPGCCDWSQGDNECRECVPKENAVYDCYGSSPPPNPDGVLPAGGSIGF